MEDTIMGEDTREKGQINKERYIQYLKIMIVFVTLIAVVAVFKKVAFDTSRLIDYISFIFIAFATYYGSILISTTMIGIRYVYKKEETRVYKSPNFDKDLKSLKKEYGNKLGSKMHKEIYGEPKPKKIMSTKERPPLVRAAFATILILSLAFALKLLYMNSIIYALCYYVGTYLIFFTNFNPSPTPSYKPRQYNISEKIMRTVWWKPFLLSTFNLFVLYLIIAIAKMWNITMINI